MNEIYKKYIDETFDERGMVLGYDFHYPENFNFSYDVIDAIAAAEPDRRAMIWCDPAGNERRFTYGEMKKYSDKTANMLTSLGVKKGDRVLLILKRHYQFWFTVYALEKIGAIAVPATFLLMKHDIVYRINAAGISCVVCTGTCEVCEHIDEAEPECPSLQTKIMVNGKRDGWLDFDTEWEKASDVFPRRETKADEPMLMYFTSGTSGSPKMALHMHTLALGHLTTAKYWHNVDPDGIHLTISDTGWAKAAWGKIYGQFFMESCTFVYDFDKFNAVEILGKIEKYRITSLCCPPTMFRFMLLEDVKSFDLSSLKYCNIAGEALSPDVFNKWYDATGIRLMEGFGQTETTVIVANRYGITPKPGSMGVPMPHYDVHIVDEDGNDVARGKVGEIVIRTAEKVPVGLFKGYYRDEEKTAEAWHDGWYHTGDTAWMDEDGYYWYVGRTDDVIKSSGYRIGPFEIESVLAEHPSVLEVAVTGYPDAIRGFIVKATIVLRDGYTGSEELTKELQQFVKHRTAPYKYPRRIEYVESLPKTTSGKIRRVEIKNRDNEAYRRAQEG